MSCVIRFDTLSREMPVARRMADVVVVVVFTLTDRASVKSEIIRIVDVNCRAFLRGELRL